MNPSTTAHEDVLPVVDLLRQKIHEQGFTEPEVAEALNWRATSFEDLRAGTRRLYVDDVLAILGTVGVEARAFFTELYGPPPRSDGPPAELAGLSNMVDSITELLIENGYFTAGELARATAAHAGRGTQQKTGLKISRSEPRTGEGDPAS